MTKLIFFLIIGFSLSSFSQTLRVERTNKQGFSGIDILEKKNNKFYIDGKNVGSTLPKRISQIWAEVLAPQKLQSAKIKICSAGTFKITHQKTPKAKPLIIEGCAEGKEYGAYLSKVYHLREYAKTVK